MECMMALKKIIRKGDTTSHGGTVIEGIESYPIFDKPVACEGHMTICPLCKGTFPIAEGVQGKPILGKYPAVEGMKTTCGAELIASQDIFLVEVPNESPKQMGRQFSIQFLLTDNEGDAVQYTPYRVLHNKDVYETGITDKYGRTEEIFTEQAIPLHVEIDIERLITG